MDRDPRLRGPRYLIQTGALATSLLLASCREGAPQTNLALREDPPTPTKPPVATIAPTPTPESYGITITPQSTPEATFTPILTSTPDRSLQDAQATADAAIARVTQLAAVQVKPEPKVTPTSDSPCVNTHLLGSEKNDWESYLTEVMRKVPEGSYRNYRIQTLSIEGSSVKVLACVEIPKLDPERVGPATDWEEHVATATLTRQGNIWQAQPSTDTRVIRVIHDSPNPKPGLGMGPGLTPENSPTPKITSTQTKVPQAIPTAYMELPNIQQPFDVTANQKLSPHALTRAAQIHALTEWYSHLNSQIKISPRSEIATFHTLNTINPSQFAAIVDSQQPGTVIIRAEETFIWPDNVCRSNVGRRTEVEITRLRAEINKEYSVTEADRLNGISWKGWVLVEFASRYRSAIACGNIVPPIPPQLRFSDWDNERGRVWAKSVNGAWTSSNPPGEAASIYSYFGDNSSPFTRGSQNGCRFTDAIRSCLLP